MAAMQRAKEAPKRVPDAEKRDSVSLLMAKDLIKRTKGGRNLTKDVCDAKMEFVCALKIVADENSRIIDVKEPAKVF